MSVLLSEPEILTLDLMPFRRRIRLLRAWRCAAMGGCVGAGLSVALAILDGVGMLDLSLWQIGLPLACGLLAGVARAVLEPLSDDVVARSVDRRGKLADRLTSASELTGDAVPFGDSLRRDAHAEAQKLRPSVLYPMRVGRWQAAFALLVLAGVLAGVAGRTTVFRSAQDKQDAAQLKHAADEVQRVSRPVLEEAKRADAAPDAKALARQLSRFSSDLRRARLTRQQALVRANELAQQAQNLQTARAVSLAQSVQAAQTAAQKMAAMQGQAGLEKTDAAKLGEQAAQKTAQIAALQQQLSAASKGGKSSLSAAQKAALEKQLAAAQKALQQIHLSQQAQHFLQKLQSLPDYQEAQKLLAKLAAQAQAQQSGQQTPLTPEQMQQIADRLDALAKQFGTDAAMREYARQMLEAARNARLGKNAGLGAGLLGAFGLSTGGLSLGGQKGAGMPSPDHWIGDHGTLQKSDKSTLLHVPFKDRQISSQIGSKGPETYTEVLGPPSAPGSGSGVPYQAVLPRYEKSAEAALNKADVPPPMRAKVRDYFNSLRK